MSEREREGGREKEREREREKERERERERKKTRDSERIVKGGKERRWRRERKVQHKALRLSQECHLFQMTGVCETDGTLELHMSVCGQLLPNTFILPLSVAGVSSYRFTLKVRCMHLNCVTDLHNMKPPGI